ncbi:DUF6958 family protein [Pseudalkalibacillus berkeleyi]|uniref:Uncharacterized protein n=1 Tax=Pseudalkalibacillus berkeleyi TaxID=1069813 RepID=A0ABS9H241_9BACL|nr:hypothetical protein [Pseudalkalibacillus berkeleyi]MCF6137710.1 hypothetical protein [Pseudalkalibacillus berkeleyi]
MEERVQLLHPDSKEMPSINKEKYNLVKKTIIDIIRENNIITFKNLSNESSHRLNEILDGSPSWYVTSVKLDLEARGIIERLAKTSPQQLQLVKDED